MTNNFNSDIDLTDFGLGSGDGLRATVAVVTDLETSMYLALAILIGMTVALAIYAKFLR